MVIITFESDRFEGSKFFTSLPSSHALRQAMPPLLKILFRFSATSLFLLLLLLSSLEVAGSKYQYNNFKRNICDF